MRGNTTTDSIDIRRIIEKYCEQLYVNNIDNLDEMHKFLKIQTTKPHWHLICI